MSLCMFGIILERFLSLTKESIVEREQDAAAAELNESGQPNAVHALPEDAKIILPSIKVKLPFFPFFVHVYFKKWIYILDLVWLVAVQ